MKQWTTFLIFLTTAYSLAAQTPDGAGIVYVKKGSTENGSSWNSATGELADALKAAKNNPAIKQIWVAAGTYKPMYSPADNNFGNPAGRDNSFLLVDRVAMYGGFPGIGNPEMGDRNPAAFETILSGDLDNSNSINDNDAYHVVVVGSLYQSNPILDGFTITGGNANNTSAAIIANLQAHRFYGGGLLATRSEMMPTISNCIFKNNSAILGGAITNQSWSDISNCSFINNIAEQRGGAIYNTGSGYARTRNSFFTKNEARNGGAMIAHDYAITIMSNCTMYGNGRNGLSSLGVAPIELRNCIIWNNQEPLHVIYNTGSIAYIHNNNLIENNSGYYQEKTILVYNKIDAIGIIDKEIFVNAPGGNFRLQKGSPAINVGKNLLYPTESLATDKDLAGNPRLVGTNIDIGAYEYNKPSNVTLHLLGARMQAGELVVNWKATHKEEVDHFEIEVSANGRLFKTVAVIAPKVPAANGSTDISYEYHVDNTRSASTLGLIALGLLLGLGLERKRRGSLLIACCLLLTASSCLKDNAHLADRPIYIRIAQVDKDGTKTYSKVIQVSNE